jgi:hypothetical protein
MRIAVAVLLLTAALLGATPLGADDVSQSDAFLCAAIQATGCVVNDECVIATPSYWKIPEFIEVDLAKKTLSTTQASSAYRVTPIKHVERADGLIILQGAEAGRAFSFVIHEESGSVSVAVARENVTVSVFGACTPLGSGR